MGSPSGASALPAAGSSRLVFALCAAFAAPLLAALDRKASAFHFWGTVESGRRQPLWVVSAVYSDARAELGPISELRGWENFVRNPWRIACEPRDGPLLLCKFEGASIGDKAAAVASVWGSDPLGRSPPLALSEGEARLEALEAPEGLHHGLINIPADAGCGYGIFETAQPRSPEHAATTIMQSAFDLRGLAGALWLREANALIAVLDREIEAGRATRRMQWFERFGVGTNPGHEPFEIIALAGEWATDKGLTGWPRGHASKCVARCAEAASGGSQRKASVVAVE